MRDASAELQYARGCFEAVSLSGTELTVSGWMLLPDVRFDSARIYIDGKLSGEAPMQPRDDVAEYYPWIENAKSSGFTFVQSSDSSSDMLDIKVVGTLENQEIARMETWFHRRLFTAFPLPPAHQMKRVANHANGQFYLLGGMQAYTEFWRAIRQHSSDIQSCQRILDWGCGSGRMTGFLVRFSKVPEVYGCDVDSEAIQWCQQNLLPGIFATSPFYPPTLYPDAFFDVVVAYSVFTHLSMNNQMAWLRELQRIIAPGGLLLASIHGDFVARFTLRGEKDNQQLQEEGFCDAFEDNNLDGIAPKGQYRGVFQTKEYTLKSWSRYFKILDYKERGTMNFHDLVVMQKR